MNKILIIDDDHGYRDVVSIAAKIGKHILLLHGATYSIKLPKRSFP